VHDVAWVGDQLWRVQFGRSRQQGNGGEEVAMRLSFVSNSTVWVLVAQGMMVCVVINYVVLDSGGKCGSGDAFFRGSSIFPIAAKVPLSSLRW
jgi:hypothetical protein